LLFKPGRERTRAEEDKGETTKRARWRYLPSAGIGAGIGAGIEQVSSF
jgi:hypothetical protein